MSNQYTYSVPFTEKELYDCYVNQKMSQSEVAKKFGTTQKVVWRAMKKMSIPTRKAAPRNQVGEANNNWKGGRVLVAVEPGRPKFKDNGYWYIYDPEHPNVNKSGYVAEHIKVVTDQAGKPLRKNECVHHINLNRIDNSPENLAIADRQTHAMWHTQLQQIAVKLIQKGLVTFDIDNGYQMKQIKATDTGE